MNYANGVDLFVRRRCGPSFPGWFLFMPLVLHTGHSTNRFKIPSSSVLIMFNAYIKYTEFPSIHYSPSLPSFLPSASCLQIPSLTSLLLFTSPTYLLPSFLPINTYLLPLLIKSTFLPPLPLPSFVWMRYSFVHLVMLRAVLCCALRNDNLWLGLAWLGLAGPHLLIPSLPSLPPCLPSIEQIVYLSHFKYILQW